MVTQAQGWNALFQGKMKDRSGVEKEYTFTKEVVCWTVDDGKVVGHIEIDDGRYGQGKGLKCAEFSSNFIGYARSETTGQVIPATPGWGGA